MFVSGNALTYENDESDISNFGRPWIFDCWVFLRRNRFYDLANGSYLTLITSNSFIINSNGRYTGK